MIIPHHMLSPEALHRVIEAFITREGTDYGEKEFSLEDKVARVVSQLERGEARIVFDPESASVTIVAGHRRIDGAPGR